jgi:hypothetical protein
MIINRRYLTDEEIENAKKEIVYSYSGYSEPLHQHNDCIRICYEWLDAQEKMTIKKVCCDYKHDVQHWAKRYVSRADFEVAAFLHPEIKGEYPKYNLRKVTVLPSITRLANIGEAGKHPNYKSYPNQYRKMEEPTGRILSSREFIF